jgi:hypothetical protein
MEQRQFESGSRRDDDSMKPLPMELNPYMLMRYGYHMKKGQKYGDGNWELGQPDKEVWRSMDRHYTQAKMCHKFPEQASKMGIDKEDHLSAILFGLNMLMHNECLNDVPVDRYFTSTQLEPKEFTIPEYNNLLETAISGGKKKIKMARVISCFDKQNWYADKIGRKFPVRGVDEQRHAYMVVFNEDGEEHGGDIGIEDAEILEIEVNA